MAKHLSSGWPECIKTKKRKRTLKGAILGSALLLSLAGSASLLLGNRVSVSAVDPSRIYDNETIYDNVGHYAFAIAANNNVNRGNVEGQSYASTLITPDMNEHLPSNISQIIEQIQAQGYTVNNLSGSLLDVDGGTVEHATIRAYNATSGCSGAGIEEVVIIGPDGNFIITDYHDDITDFVNGQNDPSGWYFVSFIGHNRALNPAQCNQVSWAVAAVYEKPDLEVSHIKLIATETPLSANEGDWFKAEEYVMFDSPLDPSNEVELIGIYTASGVNSWSGAPEESNDETWAVLEDESEQLLEEAEYNGKTVFAGRTGANFANLVVDIPSENRSHSYAGGELDVFDETLSSDFFDGHQVIGYHIKKTGYNILVPVLFGIRQELDTSKATITAHIPADDPTHPTVNIANTGVASICNVEVETPLSSIGNPTAVSTVPSAGVDTTIADDNLILDSSSLATSSNIALNLTVAESDDETISIAPVLTYRLSTTGTCDGVLDDTNSVEMTVTDEDIIYRVLTRFVDEAGEEIAESTRVYAHSGDNYVTSPKTVEGYTLSTTPEDDTGAVGEEPITITYIYTKNEEPHDEEPKDDEPNDDEPKDDESDKKESSPAVPNTGLFTGQNGAAFATASILGTMVSGIVFAILFRFTKKKEESETDY